MADKKESGTVLERTYNVPLRREYQKAPRWKRTEKAVVALRQFLKRHMKGTEVKLGKEVNEEIWKHGIRNPPHHVKVTVTKDKEGIVHASLFGEKKESKQKKAAKEEKKEEGKASVPVAEEKKEVKPKKEA